MPVKKKSVRKVEVEVEVTDQPAIDEQPQVMAAEEIGLEEMDKENDKPILVTETEGQTETAAEVEPTVDPEVATDPEPEPDTASVNSSQIFGPQPVDPPKSNKKTFWVIIILFAVLGAAAGGIGIYLQNNGSIGGFMARPTPTPEVTEPTPTPAAELDRSELSIQVLNGSGVTGAAKTAQEYLEGLGYSVDAVGNADESDLETTQVAIKSEKEEFSDLVKEDLSEQYTVDEEVGELDEDSTYDVVITLGLVKE